MIFHCRADFFLEADDIDGALLAIARHFTMAASSDEGNSEVSIDGEINVHRYTARCPHESPTLSTVPLCAAKGAPSAD